jgi:hypothetical protein
MSAESAAYGRSLAAKMGKPAPANMDWAAWGDAARRALENNAAPPTMEQYVRKADILPMPPMAPAEARAIVRESQLSVRERNSIDFIAPKNCREVIRLRELRVITRREARRMLGLPVRWWLFGH